MNAWLEYPSNADPSPLNQRVYESRTAPESETRGYSVTTASKPAQATVRPNTSCLKCGAHRTHSAGTRIRKLEQTRVLMRRCPTCNCQFTDYRFAPQPLDSRKSPPRSVGQTRAARSQRQTLKATKSNNATGVNAGSRPTDFSHRNPLTQTHQRLELDLPSDWSVTGLQGFTAFAQNELHRASQSFEQPMLAELAWQRLDPALRDYIRARQRFELALSLQWNATFQTLRSSSHTDLPPSITTDLEMTTQSKSQVAKRSQNASNPARVNSRRPAKRGAKPVDISQSIVDIASNGIAGVIAARKSVPPIQPASVGDPLEEPDPVQSLGANLEPLLRVEQAHWRRERLELKQQLLTVEAEREALFGKWTKVKGYLERQKASNDNPLRQTRGESTDPRALERSPSLAVSPSQAANIERLSSALMAHLVRLEGYRVKIRDIPSLTGELAPWRVVITHLLERGAVQREGNGQFIALSLVERLRRNLPARAGNLVGVKTKTKGVGVR